MTKSQIRQQFRDICKAIPKPYKEDAALAAAKLFLTLPEFHTSKKIACYLAMKNEMDASPIIEAIWRAKKDCYLPVVKENNEKMLQFVRYQYGDSLRTNHYGILEPSNLSHPISPDHLELVITPLLAFDCYGHRLGSGQGYYDQTFAFLSESPHQQPTLIGLAYSAQQTAHLPNDPWDIPLKGVLTEREFIVCR